MVDWIKRRITATALSVAGAIVFLQLTIMPPFLDFVGDLMLMGLIGLVGWTNSQNPPR